MRSRSANTSNSCLAKRTSACSRASAACPAKDAAISSCSSSKAIAPTVRSRMSTPAVDSPPPSGNTRAGPNAKSVPSARFTASRPTFRGSWSMKVLPEVEPSMGISLSFRTSAPLPSHTATTSSAVSSSSPAGSAMNAKSASASSAALDATRCNALPGSTPPSSSAVMSAVARCHCSRRRAC
ncbi:Uncharacterised protein [Mycobacteroides abscessus subsp. abscessus]|nr:Uncharacterised protein [Mycobacteroides abscessus subsp. abscessus]